MAENRLKSGVISVILALFRTGIPGAFVISWLHGQSGGPIVTGRRPEYIRKAERKLMKSSRKRKYISGIYNYCDRWCERCPMTHRCFLYAQETRARKRQLETGKDTDDLEIVLQDVQNNLSEAMKMISEKAGEEGIDLDEGMEEAQEEIQSDRDFCSHHPLHEKAFLLAKQSHAFLEMLASEIQLRQCEGSTEEELTQVQDCFEVLSWYHMQQAVKVDRCLRGLRHAAFTGNPDHTEAVVHDTNGSAKVAYLGLIRMLDAYTRIHEWNSSWNSQLMPLIHSVFEIMDAVDAHFPGHHTFKRPGFND